MQTPAHAAAASAADAGAPYSDANVATTLSLLPFSEHCKLRDDGVAKPLIRGRYTGMCGGDPAQRERRDDFEHITLASPSSSPSPSARTTGAAAAGGGPGSRSSSSVGVWGQVEAYSRSAAGKTIDPAHQRTPLALEKTMHFLVEHYLRVPHTPLVYTEPFRVWGYLWDRFRGIRTTWGPQLPPSNVRLDGYVDSETGALLPVDQLRQESYRRVRWLEFTAAALAVGGAYLCCSPEGCQRFMQDKKQFLESMSQCFTDLTVFYRAEQRPRNAEFFSVLLMLYGLQQEMKVEDRSTFCRFYTITVDGEPRLCPESTAESVNFAQVYRELEKQPYMLETQPVQIALQLLHTWSRRQWFAFFELCRSARMTPLQRAVVFQSFTYARFRAVLDLVLPNHYVYPRLRVRHAVPVAELAGQLMMEEEHCLEFLKRMGLGAQLEYRAASPAATSAAAFSPVGSGPGEHRSVGSSSSALGWFLNLCHPNSTTPLVTADELEKRCDNKRVLFFPTYPSFFGFRVAHEAYARFPGAKGMARPASGRGGGVAAGASGAAANFEDSSGSPVGRGAVRSPSALPRQGPPRARPHRRASPDGDEADGDEAGDDFYRDEYGSSADDGDEEDGGDVDGDASGSHASTSAPRETSGTVTPPAGASASAPRPPHPPAEAAVLRQLGCPVNLMEVLEVYCPPYHAEVAALRLCDTSDILFADLPRHRAAMLRRCRRARRLSRHWRDAAAAVSLKSAEDAAEDDEASGEDWCAKMELESASTASSLYDGGEESAGDVADDDGDADNEEVAPGDAERHGAAAGEVSSLVSEARKLVTSIRDSPLYAAAAADREAAAAAAKRTHDARPGSPVPFPPSPFSHHTAAQQQQQQQSHNNNDSTPTVLALTETAGRCVVVPLPDDHRADPAERCNSENARVVVESPTTLPAPRLADLLQGNGRAASPAPPLSHAGAAADQAETVEARVQSPLTFSQRGPAAAASRPPPPTFRTAMPPTTTTTPGKRSSDGAVREAAVTPTPGDGGGARRDGHAGRAGSADSSGSGSGSRGSSAPLLGYSHLKPAREGSASRSTAEVEDVRSEGGSDEADYAAAASSSTHGRARGGPAPARSRSTSASEGSRQSDQRGDLPTAPPSPALPALWEPANAPVPATSPASAVVVVDSFTPRPLSSEPAPAASAALVVRDAQAGALTLVPDGPRDLVPVPDRAHAAESRKRYKLEVSRGSRAARDAVAQPVCPPLSRSCVNVFARVCVPLIEEYLQLWTQLTHGDVEAMQTAAQYVVDVRAAERKDTASGDCDERHEEGPGTSAHRWRSRRSSAGASFADGSVNAAWWHERQLQRTRASMQRAASRLFTAAVLRGRMSEYGQLMYDLSLSSGATAMTTRGFGVRSGFTSIPSNDGFSLAPGGTTDDARAAQFSQGCSVAMLSSHEAARMTSAAASLLGSAHLRYGAAVAEAGEEERRRHHQLHAWRRQSEAALHRIVRGALSSGPAPPVRKAADAAEELVQLLAAAASAGLDAAAARERADLLAGDASAAVAHTAATAATVLQITSNFVWVAQQRAPATVTPTTCTAAGAAEALASLFPSTQERWLVSLLLPATATNVATASALEADDDGGAAWDWRLPQASLQGRKRRRRHAPSHDATCDGSGGEGGVTWLRVDGGVADGAQDAPRVARLLLRDELSHVPVVSTSASAAPNRSVRVVASRSLLSRIALYGCDTQALPRLRVRRDGTVRLTQAHTHADTAGDTIDATSPSTTAAAAAAAAVDSSVRVTADGGMLQAAAMSHAHYTALLTVDATLPQDARHAALLRALAAVVASHVPATHATSHGAVAEQNTVAGVLVCVLRDIHGASTAAVEDDTAGDVEALFQALWQRRHDTDASSSKASGARRRLPVPPPVVCVDVAYGDAAEASAAVEAGMQALLSTYAERAVMALAEDAV